jgi:two-component system response regulator YesN
MENQRYPCIVINVCTATFQIVGSLLHRSTNPLIQIFHNVLTSLTFFSDSSEQSTGTMNKQNKQSMLVEKTCEYLLKNIDQDLNQEKIASAMNTNRDRLSRAFKEEIGIGLGAWLRQQRMSIAKEKLLATDSTVCEISASVGYYDQANFSTTFKREFAKSPQQYRKEGRRKLL